MKTNCLEGKNFQQRLRSMLKSFRRIIDDQYEHALRLFRDRDTSVIRLQASVQTGALKRSEKGSRHNSHICAYFVAESLSGQPSSMIKYIRPHGCHEIVEWYGLRIYSSTSSPRNINRR